MDYNTYKERIRTEIGKRLGEGVEVGFLETVKNNDTKKEALSIRTGGETVTPLIYIRDFYREYEATGDMEAGIRKILKLYEDRKGLAGEYSCPGWKEAGPRIRIRLAGKERNREYLKGIPYQEVLDLAVFFCVELGECTDGTASVCVTWELLECWGIGFGELCRTAVENLKNEPCRLDSLSGILEQLCGLKDTGDAGEELYVLTTADGSYGARAMLRGDILKEFADRHGSSFFILPSSRHEVLLCRDHGWPEEAGMLKETVCGINRDARVMDTEDVLTDTVYYYDRETGEVRIAA